MGSSRAEREQAFWDGEYEQQARVTAWKFYDITESSDRYHRELMFDGCEGKRVLEYGCWDGSLAIDLARHGATVTGIDISNQAIEGARLEAKAAGVSDRTTFAVMNAEELNLPDVSFDRVYGRSILHHLDLPRALSEIRRVLAPGGRAVFYEPLGCNPLINFYRHRTPDKRSVDEQPLRSEELKLMREYFPALEMRYFHLVSIAAVFWRGRPGFKVIVRALETVDRGLFAIPWIRKQAWIVVITLQ